MEEGKRGRNAVSGGQWISIDQLNEWIMRPDRIN